ncbi:MAG: transaldolase [Planctomycetota bacterium]|nr:transaldolase [Planctomycetota bacterium]RLS37055.1 MAG: transaldolase [Planctomycetota bacterium]
MSSLKSLVATGTKLWLDSIDPDLVRTNRALGATGATSNPIIISDLLKTGRFDGRIKELLQHGHDDEAVAWAMTNELVHQAQEVFLPVWEQTRCNDGWVSFELDPLLEDAACPLDVPAKASRYIELGKKWSAGHKNRMIKVPATPGGLAALEELAAAGITLNVTLIFSEDQYFKAREAVWKGAQRRPGGLTTFKSVYSIFVSRLDVYTKEKVPSLSEAAQGQVGIVNAKKVWKLNQLWWADKKVPLQQEIIFASTGTKDPKDDPTKYVAAFAGSDIETNPPGTNAAVEKSGRTFTREVDLMPPAAVVAEIEAKVSMQDLEETLMREGLSKFADPFKKLLAQIAGKRQELGA